MAATKRNAMAQTDLRSRIKGQQLVEKLQNQVLAPKSKKIPPLTDTQARIALALLKKILPDLQVMQFEGTAGEPIQFIMQNRPAKESKRG